MKTNTCGLKRKFLTFREVEKMLSATGRSSNPERDYCLVYMAFIHGLRVTELRSIRLSDVDLDTGAVYVRRLKNGFSTVHPFAREEKEVIRAWMVVRATETGAGSDWLFPSHQSGPLSRQRIHVIVSELGQKAGLSVKACPHMLRHACGFALADRGLDTRLIQDYLGHRNIRHTVWYTASNPARFSAVWGEEERNAPLRFNCQNGPNCIATRAQVNHYFPL
jgi:type 1 fimbriae regulatory protein FimB